MIKPNFIIVGVFRCGTTSLFHYLKQHPEINFPRIKEPKYFSSFGINFPQKGPGDKTIDEGIVKCRNEYYELFKNLDSTKKIGEASSDYFYYHKSVIPRIKRELGDVKIIICLRNPVDRSISAYNNLRRDSRETLLFEDAIEKENDRSANSFDCMWSYLRGSLYYEGVKNFKNNFSNVHIIFFESFIKNPRKELDEIFDFLEISKDESIDTSVQYSVSGESSNFLFRLISSRTNIIYSLRKIFLKCFPRKYCEWIAKKFIKKIDCNEKTKEELFDFFSKDISDLEGLLQVSLKEWKRKK